MDNDFQTSFSNVLGATNILDVGGQQEPIVNRRLPHHFKPLADLFSRPSFQVHGFFSNDFTANKVYDHTDSNVLESYYLKNMNNTVAIGWIHNRNAWVRNSFYLKNSREKIFGCAAPNSQSQSISLSGFEPSTEYFTTWFPTRTNSTTIPPQMEEVFATDGEILIDLSTHFVGVTDNYLDTLRSDYAFIVTPGPFFKSLPPIPDDEPDALSDWDFTLYPNPANQEVTLSLPSIGTKNITVFDMTGRRVLIENGIAETPHTLCLGRLAKGPYWVCLTNGVEQRVKKLIIQ